MSKPTTVTVSADYGWREGDIITDNDGPTMRVKSVLSATTIELEPLSWWRRLWHRIASWFSLSTISGVYRRSVLVVSLVSFLLLACVASCRGEEIAKIRTGVFSSSISVLEWIDPKTGRRFLIFWQSDQSIAVVEATPTPPPSPANLQVERAKP